MILAGDVGGTKVHLALYNFANGRLQPVRDEKFPAQSLRAWSGGEEVPCATGKEKRTRLLRRASAVRGRCAMGG